MAKIRSFSAKLYLNGIAVGGITDISATGTDVNFVDTTSHDTAGGFRTFVSGLKDGGTLDVTGKYNYADAGQDEWKSEEGVKHPLYIVLSDSSGMSFSAIVGGFQTSNPLDDAVEFSGTAKITGIVSPVFPTMSVTGTLTSDGSTAATVGTMALAATLASGKLQWVTSSRSVSWDGTKWNLTNGSDIWTSTAAVASPDLVPSGDWHTTNNPHAWKPTSPATGTPVVAGS